MLPSGSFVTDMKHGSWLLGGGWNNDLWGGMFPMASWIDDITPNNPVGSLNVYRSSFTCAY